MTTDTTTTMTTTDTTTTTDTPVDAAAPTGVMATRIHPAELVRLREEDSELRILDVRTTAEFESIHIPGSFNVPLDLLAEHVSNLADLAHPIVLVCASGNRATTAHRHLTDAGKSNLRILEGGMSGWQAAGGEVARGEAKWTLERQVRGVAGSLVLASILVSLVSPRARLLAGGVGLGLTFSAITDTCTMGNLLARLPYNRGPECDLDCVLDEIRA